ncbi:MAG: hypothetical protein FWG89_08330 [Treponema sp.]|nr:hypothetical protein [Treponema sp.]
MKLKVEQITDSERKTKTVMDYYGPSIDNDEISNSEVWTLITEDTENIIYFLMVMKKNLWDNPQDDSIKITHLNGHSSIFEKEYFMKFYLFVERYYVNNGFDSFNVSIPKIKGTTYFRKFFKRAGFFECKEFKYNVAEEKSEVKTLFMKSNFLEDWYVKEDGSLFPITVTGENGEYKPIKKKIAKKLNLDINL